MSDDASPTQPAAVGAVPDYVRDALNDGLFDFTKRSRAAIDDQPATALTTRQSAEIAADFDDADNWLTIPAFGVAPTGPDYIGFAEPICAGPLPLGGIVDRLIREDCRVIVRNSRRMVRRSFDSLEAIRDARRHFYHDYLQAAKRGTTPRAPTPQELAATSYGSVIDNIRGVLQGRSHQLMHMANAAAVMASWLTGDLGDLERRAGALLQGRKKGSVGAVRRLVNAIGSDVSTFDELKSRLASLASTRSMDLCDYDEESRTVWIGNSEVSFKTLQNYFSELRNPGKR